MWRIAASIGLMFGAVAWSVIAMVAIFLFVPSLWEALFGPRGAPVGAMLALAGVVWCAAKLMRLADRLIGEPEHRLTAAHSGNGPPPALATAEAETPVNWPDYNAQIARNKRWAFYRRTHQYDRLRALEAERPGSG